MAGTNFNETTVLAATKEYVDAQLALKQDVGPYLVSPIAEADVTDLVTDLATKQTKIVTVLSKSALYTLLDTDSGKYFLVDTSGGGFDFTLPTLATGLIFFIKDSTGSFNTNNLNLVPVGGVGIDGVVANKSLETDWGSYVVLAGPSGWVIL